MLVNALTKIRNTVRVTAS